MAVNAVWSAVEYGDLPTVQALGGASMDWKALHPKHRTPVLLNIVFPSVRALTKFELQRLGDKYLKIAAWLLQHGAVPLAEAPENCCGAEDISSAHCPHGAAYLPLFSFKGHSAISLIVELRRQMTCSSHAWESHIDNLNKLLTVLIQQPARSIVGVDESVIEVWEKARNDCSQHDVGFETAGDVVTAHGHMLCKASPVLSKMLSSCMLEGQRKRIQVKDSPAEAVSLFLDLLYTGTTSQEPDTTTIIAAFDLAHRWTVCGVVNMLERAMLTALRKSLSADHFCAIAEVAILKELPGVRAACVRLADESAEVKQRMRSKQFPKGVLEMLGAGEDATLPVQAKKQRIVF